jgi:hypothetical protein
VGIKSTVETIPIQILDTGWEIALLPRFQSCAQVRADFGWPDRQGVIKLVAFFNHSAERAKMGGDNVTHMPYAADAVPKPRRAVNKVETRILDRGSGGGAARAAFNRIADVVSCRRAIDDAARRVTCLKDIV